MADNIFGVKRNIDIVFCIDGTGSMSPIIEAVKKNARNLQREFVSAMTDNGAEIDSLRIKVITFRDYGCDTEPMRISPFFELPSDVDEYEAELSKIEAIGGGDNPENGLEAIYFALKSDFTQGPKDRQVIVLFTDDEALELKERAGSEGYPSDMVDEKKLVEIWTCMGQDTAYKLKEKTKRIVIFAPKGTKYEELSNKLNRSIYQPVDPSAGMGDIDFSSVIQLLAASASGV